MTDGERQLILRRLVDRDLLPWNSEKITPAAIKALSARERAVFVEELEREIKRDLAGANALLRASAREMSGFARLKARTKLRWASLRLLLAKKGV